MTTDTGTLERTDTGTHAVVRPVDPAPPVSAPYSRLCGILDKQVAAERRAVDEFAAWLEGQTAQTAAEIRSAADEQLHQHRQVRVDIAERNRREGTFNLPPAFEEIPPVWAELPEDKPARQVTALMDKNNPRDRIGLGVGPALRARYGTVGGRSPFDTSPAPDENMPGRVALPRRNDVFDRPFVPDPADYGPRPAIEQGPRGGFWRRIDARLERVDSWLRRKQADSDKRIGG